MNMQLLKFHLMSHKKHLQENYSEIIKETFMEVTGSIFKFKYVTKDEIDNNQEKQDIKSK